MLFGSWFKQRAFLEAPRLQASGWGGISLLARNQTSVCPSVVVANQLEEREHQNRQKDEPEHNHPTHRASTTTTTTERSGWTFAEAALRGTWQETKKLIPARLHHHMIVTKAGGSNPLNLTMKPTSHSCFLASKTSRRLAAEASRRLASEATRRLALEATRSPWTRRSPEGISSLSNTPFVSG